MLICGLHEKLAERFYMLKNMKNRIYRFRTATGIGV